MSAFAVFFAGGEEHDNQRNDRGLFRQSETEEGLAVISCGCMVFTSFTSPVKQVAGKAEYLESTKNFYGGIVGFEVRDLIIDADKACARTRYRLQRPKGPAFESDVAEIFRVREGKIISFDIYFDTAPFPK